MSSNSKISHRGRIVEITPDITTVEIVSESACASCHAKSLCGLGETKNKLVQLPTSGWIGRNVGDEVNLVLKTSMGHKAVWVAYVIPLFVMVVMLMVLTASGAGELVSGLFSILSVAVYYFVIWLLRDKLKNDYNFKIE